MRCRHVALVSLLAVSLLPGRAAADPYGACHVIGTYDETYGEVRATAFMGLGESASVSGGSFKRVDLFGKLVTPPGVVPLPVGVCGTTITRVDGGFLLTEWVGDTLRASTIDDVGRLITSCTSIHTRSAGGYSVLAARDRAIAVAWSEPGTTPGSKDLYLQPIDLATLTPTRTTVDSVVLDEVPLQQFDFATTGGSFGLMWRNDGINTTFLQIFEADGAARTTPGLVHDGFDYFLDYGIWLEASASSYGLYSAGWYSSCLCTWYVGFTVRDESGGALAPTMYLSCPEEMTIGGLGFADGFFASLTEDSFHYGGIYTAAGAHGFGPGFWMGNFPLGPIRGTASYLDEIYDCSVEMAGPFYFVRDGASSDAVRIECPATFGAEFRLNKGSARDLSDLASLGYHRTCPIVDAAAPTAPGLTTYRLGP